VGLRFYRRLHVCPGLSLNMSRSGPSLTFGVRGAHVTVGGTGIRKTVGIPGTGLYYTSRHGYHTGYHSAKGEAPRPPDQQAAVDTQAERTLGLIVLGAIIIIAIALLR
jgi:Protein of unknown function (DUF4236)